MKVGMVSKISLGNTEKKLLNTELCEIRYIEV